VIGPFHKSPQDKLAEELEQLEKTKAELERQARELETVLNIPPQPKAVEEPAKGARFLSMDEEHPLQSPALENTARLKVEQRRAKRRVLTLIAIVGILLLVILRMLS